MAGVKVFRPALRVTLIKLVARTGDGLAARYTGAARIIDLTPYLGDGGTVRTAKGIREPAGGFSVSIGDKMSPQGRDTLAAMIEPMDLIEIRAAREPHLYAGQSLPLIMRGFVSSVSRAEGIGQDGSPQRAVVITGHDAGKLWQINQVLFQLAYLTDSPFLTTFKMQSALGMEVAMLPVSEFMRQLVERVMNPKVQQLAAFSSQIVKPFTVDDVSVKYGQVSVTTSAGFQGPLWNLVRQYADDPWNEVFIEDREDGPAFVFRAAPFKGLDGKFIMPDAVDPGTVDLDIAAVQSLELGRSDARVANIFWVPPGASMLDSSAAANTASWQKGEPLDFDYGNNKPELYGQKMMEVVSRLLPDDVADLPMLLPAGSARDAAVSSYVQWHQVRAAQLKAANRDNTVLEEGYAVVRGHEDLKPGRYVRLTRGQLRSELYCSRVAHTFAPLQTWTTTLSLERGTGFVERVKVSGSPYLAEGRSGPYSSSTLTG